MLRAFVDTAISSNMPIPEYQDNGPIQIPDSLNLDKLVGKSILVTGGW